MTEDPYKKLEAFDTDTFEGIIRATKKLQSQTGWRYGQALFNTLQYFHPGVANYYSGSRLDPFYAEGKAKIDAFLDDLKGWFH